jgi:hypothetical protein
MSPQCHVTYMTYVCRGTIGSHCVTNYIMADDKHTNFMYWVFLEKLVVAQQVKKYTDFMQP